MTTDSGGDTPDYTYGAEGPPSHRARIRWQRIVRWRRWPDVLGFLVFVIRQGLATFAAGLALLIIGTKAFEMAARREENARSAASATVSHLGKALEYIHSTPMSEESHYLALQELDSAIELIAPEPTLTAAVRHIVENERGDALQHLYWMTDDPHFLDLAVIAYRAAAADIVEHPDEKGLHRVYVESGLDRYVKAVGERPALGIGTCLMHPSQDIVSLWDALSDLRRLSDRVGGDGLVMNTLGVAETRYGACVNDAQLVRSGLSRLNDAAFAADMDSTDEGWERREGSRLHNLGEGEFLLGMVVDSLACWERSLSYLTGALSFRAPTRYPSARIETLLLRSTVSRHLAEGRAEPSPDRMDLLEAARSDVRDAGALVVAEDHPVTRSLVRAESVAVAIAGAELLGWDLSVPGLRDCIAAALPGLRPNAYPRERAWLLASQAHAFLLSGGGSPADPRAAREACELGVRLFDVKLYPRENAEFRNKCGRILTNG